MTIELTPQNIIMAGSVLTAVILLVTYLVKVINFFDELKQLKERVVKNEEKIKGLEESRKKAIAELKDFHNEDNGRIREEQQILIYCSLACLKGLQQLGANGDVTEAINRIEKHLNMAAHQ